MLKYVGKSFIVGIPARDLTDEEVKRFGKQKLLDSRLYAEAHKKNHKETVKQADDNSAEVTKWQE